MTELFSTKNSFTSINVFTILILTSTLMRGGLSKETLHQ